MVFNSVISEKQKTSFDLLWQNSNPNMAFAPQTVNLPTGYSAFAIEFKHRAGSTLYGNSLLYVPFSTSSRFFKLFVAIDGTGASWSTIVGRLINSATDGAIVFSGGTANGGSNNEYAVPIAIYGLKFTV